MFAKTCPHWNHVRASRPQSLRRAGFTLAEALVAMAVGSLAASSMLVATYATMFQMTDSTDRMLAEAITRQLMNEIMGLPYREKGVTPYQTTLGPVAEPNRIDYDDSDDYHGYTQSPILDRWNIQLGQGNDAGGTRDAPFRLSTRHFSNWRVTVSVNYVAENNWMTNLPPGNVSGYRAVEIVVTKTEGGVSRELARLRRVLAYVPSSST